MSEVPITQITLPPGFIDLGMGNPDLNLLPLDFLRQSAQTHFTLDDPRSLQYGFEQGDGFFRHALSDFLAAIYGHKVDPQSLFITTGVSSALDLLCTLYTHPGDLIFVEEPTYFLALRIFADHGLEVVPISMDSSGLNVEMLEAKLSEYTPRFLYTIPTFQNPSGLSLSQDRRHQLVELAQQHGFLVIADEVYHLLHYNQIPPQSIAVHAESAEQIISVNSFSKILAPGLRLGWIHAHENVINKLAGCGLLDSGGGMNPFMSALIRPLIESGGLAQNITRLRTVYAHRLNVLDEALRQYLPQAEYTLPQGGFFFWLRLHGVDLAELRPKMQVLDVDIRQGALFSSENGLRDYARLSFSYYGPDELIEGVKKLRDALS
ncbi:MAG: PLP-dependent aminotransferase family protein [Anaerolineales bacterium]|jgi:DNA-binding transcriptional MocR family regulator